MGQGRKSQLFKDKRNGTILLQNFSSVSIIPLNQAAQQQKESNGSSTTPDGISFGGK